MLRLWICQHAPRFAACQIAYSLVYLGFDIGPKSLGNKWKAQLQQFDARSKIVLSLNQAGNATAIAYSAAVLPILCYVSQLEAPPSGSLSTRRELTHFHKIYHFIPGTLPLCAFVHMRELGLQNLVPFWMINLAIPIRTASKTIAETLPSHYACTN